MKDKIAIGICEDYRGTGAWDSSTDTMKDFWRFIASQILTLIGEEIEKVRKENPYGAPDYPCYDVFELCCQKILKALEV